MTIRTTTMRLQEINAMLPYLPSDHGGAAQNVQLDDTELCSVLLRMVPRQMEQVYWVQANDVVSTDWTRLVEKLEQIEQSDALDVTKGKNPDGGVARAKSNERDNARSERGPVHARAGRAKYRQYG